jgi:hypothetical protein
VAIPKNPQIMAQKLKLHCLMFETGKRNSLGLAPAPNDFVMIFQKPGEAKTPVRCLYDPAKNPEGWVTTEQRINWASGVWDNIRETDVLDGWRSARESDEEKHVCPLQLEVIRRPMLMYTNPGELVLDPFMGIGSTAWVAVEQGREAVGFELKKSYHGLALRNVDKKQREMAEAQRDLVSMMEEAENTNNFFN